MTYENVTVTPNEIYNFEFSHEDAIAALRRMRKPYVRALLAAILAAAIFFFISISEKWAIPAALIILLFCGLSHIIVLSKLKKSWEKTYNKLREIHYRFEVFDTYLNFTGTKNGEVVNTAKISLSDIENVKTEGAYLLLTANGILYTLRRSDVPSTSALLNPKKAASAPAPAPIPVPIPEVETTTVPETVNEVVPEEVSEEISCLVSETELISESALIPDTTSVPVPETVCEPVAEIISEEFSEEVSEPISIYKPIHIPEIVPETAPKKSKLNVFSWILLIGSILAVQIGFPTLSFLIGNSPQFALPMCICLIFIPIGSIVIGAVMKKKGLRGTKNIVVGIIMTVFVSFMLFASIVLVLNDIIDYLPYEEYEYTELDNAAISRAEDILDIDLPEPEYINTYERTGNDECTEQHYVSYIHFDLPEDEDLYLGLESNPHCMTYSHLSEIAPTSNSYSFNEYIIVYNLDTGEYNTLPSESGTYHFICITYTPKSGSLDIEEYDVEYTK